jgi:hypothetical protein
MVHTQYSVNVLHALSAHVCEFLDLGRRIFDLLVSQCELELLNTALDGVPPGQAVPNGDVASETKVLGLQDLVCAGVVENCLGVDTGLVGKRTISAKTRRLSVRLTKSLSRGGTHVMGFMNGTLTSTASATKFSISRSMGRLYLFLTYSGFAAYKQAMRPPRGVIPTRSPIPKTAVVRV